MDALLLDVRRGATSGSLLGAMLEAGGSLEQVEAAVATLGTGPVRLAVRGGRDGTHVRVLAPEGTTTAMRWPVLREHVRVLAADPTVVASALATLDALAAARAAVHRVDVADVHVDPLGGPTELAAAVALAAARCSLGSRVVLTTPVGHGTGRLATLEGQVDLPGAVVARLLDALPTVALGEVVEVVDVVAAAWLRTVAGGLAPLEDGAVTAAAAVGPSGRGRVDAGRMLRATVGTAPLAA